MLRWLGDLPATTAAPHEPLAVPPAWSAGDPHTAASPPGKVRYLDTLTRAGLPVPRGFFLRLQDVWLAGHEGERLDPAVESATRTLLSSGPVIIRSALAFEDDAAFSGAGLGRSVRCTQLAAVRDVFQQQGIDARRSSHVPSTFASDPPWVLVQAWRRADVACVAFTQRGRSHGDLGPTDGSPGVVATERPTTPASPASLDTWIELHAPGEDTLSQGHDPLWAGPSAALEHPGRPALDAVVASTLHALANDDVVGASFAHGCELELVLDAQNVHLVQARPLQEGRIVTRPAPRAQLPDGLWRLDAEHNPAPLSPAHAWVIDQLQRPDMPELMVLDGWLYARAPRHPRGATTPTRSELSEPTRPLAASALRQLLQETLPARLLDAAALLQRMATVGATEWPRARDDATEHLRRCVEAHGMLATARQSARFSPGARRVTQAILRSTRALIPSAWDIAAPLVVERSDVEETTSVLMDLAHTAHHLARDLASSASTTRDVRDGGDGGDEGDEGDDAAEPLAPRGDDLRASLVGLDEAAAKSCLVELDDLLYAVGQLPLRAAWLRAAQLAGVPRRDAFGLSGDTLAAVLEEVARGASPRPPAPPFPAGAATRDESAPAEILWNRRAHPAPALARARFAVGVEVDGTFRRRFDLDDLRQRPCGRDDVVWLPTLLPQTALVLHDLGVRIVVTAFGGASSHGARMAWELDLTALLGAGGCRELDDGDHVHVDVATRTVTRTQPRRPG